MQSICRWCRAGAEQVQSILCRWCRGVAEVMLSSCNAPEWVQSRCHAGADVQRISWCRYGGAAEVLQRCCRGAAEVLQRFRGKGGADMEVLICL